MTDIERIVFEWLRGQDPDDLAAWAESGEDLESRLMRQFRVKIRGAAAARRLGLLRDDHLDGARALDAAAADRIVRALLAEAPDHGMVCWRHKTWLRAQVVHLRDRFLALVGAPA